MAYVYLDDVAEGMQRDYVKNRELLNMQAISSAAGDKLVTETSRESFVQDTRLIGAAVAQSLLGEDPLLANNALADNFAGGQPWTARPAPSNVDTTGSVATPKA